ncbi:MAG: sugar-binding domain-containing protein, partial [Bacteroidota bacterium]
MKYYSPLLLSLLLFSCSEKKAENYVREKINFNEYWTFNYYPDSEIREECTSAEFNDKSWPAVSLPHTWQTFETTGEEHPFIFNPSERDDPYWWKGWGYYRKSFTVKRELEGKHIELVFDGVQKYSKIYLNGKLIEEHKGGYNSFYIDMTPHLSYGKENVLVVVVSNRRDDVFRIPPMTAGNFNVYGGIY